MSDNIVNSSTIDGDSFDNLQYLLSLEISKAHYMEQDIRDDFLSHLECYRHDLPNLLVVLELGLERAMICSMIINDCLKRMSSLLADFTAKAAK